LPWLALAISLFSLLIFASSTLKAQTASPPEISSSEVTPSFKLQSQRNLVMVRVVVRDAKGTTVGNLQQADFQLFDRGKKQTILNFSVEKPALSAADKPAAKSTESTSATPPQAGEESAASFDAPRRFVGLYFDDINTKFEELVRTRLAAQHFLASSLQPGDRIGVFTSSGLKQLDFTADLAKVRQALLDLQPHPMLLEDSCGAIPPYEAYMIVELRDQTAINVAVEELTNCGLLNNPAGTGNTGASGSTSNTGAAAKSGAGSAASMEAQNAEIESDARQVESQAEAASRTALRGIESLVRRMMLLPGQRSIVIVSAGFLTDTLLPELDQISDRALRANVILNAIDARGLYVGSAIADASQRSTANTARADILAEKEMLLKISDQREGETLATLALSTGGVVFQNSNDLDAGFRQVAAPPEAFYQLAFSPQNLKLDGAFHPLKVTLVAHRGLSLQVRKGYYAPSKLADPAAQEKEEIQEALFSRDEMQDLPIDVHTDFFMKSRIDGQVDVLTHLDLHKLQFHKEGDRNLDHLIFSVALFDQDGHFVAGQQKSLQLRLRDASLEKYLRIGITIQSEVNVTPGRYMVRTVVRESDSGQISCLNRTVEIPY
jgi:VWFA-related protein